MHFVGIAKGEEAKLYAKYSKYEFWLSLLSFLVLVVLKKDFMVDPQNIMVVKNWTRPSSVTKNYDFVG